MTNYKIYFDEAFEKIPASNTYFLYALSYPGPLLMLYNYIFIILLSSTKGDSLLEIEFSYIVTQYLFHIVYFLMMRSQWIVRNKRRYFLLLRHPKYFILVLGHLYLFFFLHHQFFLTGPLLSFYMGAYWYLHKQVLEELNNQIFLENTLL